MYIFLVNKYSHPFLKHLGFLFSYIQGPIKKNFINKLVYKCDVKERMYFSSYIYFVYQI